MAWTRIATVGLMVGVIGGCSATYEKGGPPTVMLQSPFGPPRVIEGGGQAGGAQGSLAAPPANLSSEPPRPTETAIRDGSYSGTAEPLSTGGGVCVQNRLVQDFNVHGNAVRWGGFRGTIAPDHRLRMVFGQAWVFGQFVGSTFHGQLTMPGGRGWSQCTYSLTLKRTSD